MQTFLQDIFCWFIAKKLYDSVLQNELIKLLANHYTVDYNVQQDCLLYLQVPVSISTRELLKISQRWQVSHTEIFSIKNILDVDVCESTFSMMKQVNSKNRWNGRQNTGW